MNRRTIILFAIPIAILVLWLSAGGGEKLDLRLSPPENSSTTYTMSFFSEVGINIALEGKPVEISGNTSLSTMFTFARTGQRDNQPEYTVNYKTLRLTKNFDTGAERRRLEVDGDKVQMFRNDKLYADTDNIAALPEVSEHQRVFGITERPMKIVIKPSGRTQGQPLGDSEVVRFFSVATGRQTAFFGFRFPDNPKAVGGNWSELLPLSQVDAVKFAKGTEPTARLSYRLEKVEERRGRKVAIISLSGPIEIANVPATMPGFTDEKRIDKSVKIISLTRNLKGTMLHDLDANRPTRIEINSELKILVVMGPELPEEKKQPDEKNKTEEKDKPDSPGEKKFTPKPPPPPPLITMTISTRTVYEEKK
ncbi:MAG: hypothetical protein E3J72_11580 [Planctomycetota bacterium]|nr:MAG: hypothetical protein E3J72_11580 [Planctomycetota bacterium]